MPGRLKQVASIAAGQLLLIVVSVAGGVLFHYSRLPGPWVTGSMLGVGIVAMRFPLPRQLPDLRDLGLLLAGVGMGASVTPEALALVAAYPLSFLLLFLSVVVNMTVSSLWLMRAAGWSRVDAILASAPGALSAVLMMASERRADVLLIGIVQNIRLFALVLIVPAMATYGNAGADGAVAAAAAWSVPADPMSASGMALLLLAAALLGLVFERLRLPAGMLVGGTIGAALVSGSGLVRGALPAPIATSGFVLIGIFLGLRLGAIAPRDLVRHLPTGLVSFALGLVISMSFAGLVSWLIGIRYGSALLAFAPGGVEAMSVLSLALGLDPLYVAAHHIMRFVGISFVLPLVVARAAR